MVVLKNKIRLIGSAFNTNYGGGRIREKLVIIESDDWGAIRIPSKQILGKISNLGIDLSRSYYKNDTLCSESDMDSLYEVLNKNRDKNNYPAKMTANVITANPDFEKIKSDNFQNYFYEPITETFKREKGKEKVIEMWKKGIELNLFKPQFHGREHLNYKRWLNDLKEGSELTLKYFEMGTTYSGKNDYSYMEAFDFDEVKELENHKIALDLGLDMFKEYFGYDSQSFIAPCYTWDSKIEENLALKGVTMIQGIRIQKSPLGGLGNYKYISHKFGERNQYGMLYNIRNCFFEPSLREPNYDNVNSCLNQIKIAFLCNKPAVISSHRINYVGGIDEKKRNDNLLQLDDLLKKIIKKWPDVVFISTNELENYLDD